MTPLSLFTLAAQADSSISIGIALTLAGMLIGGALVFGAQRQNVTTLNESVKTLTEKVETLTRLVTELSTKLQVMEAVGDERAAVTAKHASAVAMPHRDSRDPRRE